MSRADQCRNGLFLRWIPEGDDEDDDDMDAPILIFEVIPIS